MMTKTQLFEETMSLYWERGIKFTMDELATRLLISKKTLYELVRSKEDLAVQVIEYYFEQVNTLQNEIHANQSLSPLEKLKQLLCATPDLPMRRVHLHELKMVFPKAFQVLDERLRLGWERTFMVMEQAKTAGLIRDFDFVLFSKIYAAAIEDIVSEPDLETGLTYRQKQEQVVDLLLFGLKTNP